MKSLTDLAGNLDASTAQVLTALRIIATRADIEEIAEWAKKELEGYKVDDELSAYRTWKLTIKANLHNPFQGFMTDVHVGDFAIEKEYREKTTTYSCRDGVWQIENMLASQDTAAFGVELPNLALLINRGPMLSDGWTCTHATAEFSPVHLTSIVNNARQTALGFCLECEKAGVDLRWGEDDQTTPEERTRWLGMIKQEGTKLILRAAWETAFRSLTGGG